MLYPVNLNLEKKRCAVIGGGKVALRKVTSLLKSKASITVISPFLGLGLEKLFSVGLISWENVYVEKTTLDGYFLVICATDDETANKRAALLAREKGALVNMATPPFEYSDFDVPSVIRNGDFLCTFSTTGKSPELSKRLKERWESKLKNYGELLEIIFAYREGLKLRFEKQHQRETFWREVVTEKMLDLVENGNFDEAEELIENALNSVGTKS